MSFSIYCQVPPQFKVPWVWEQHLWEPTEWSFQSLHAQTLSLHLHTGFREILAGTRCPQCHSVTFPAPILWNAFLRWDFFISIEVHHTLCQWWSNDEVIESACYPEVLWVFPFDVPNGDSSPHWSQFHHQTLCGKIENKYSWNQSKS